MEEKVEKEEAAKEDEEDEATDDDTKVLSETEWLMPPPLVHRKPPWPPSPFLLLLLPPKLNGCSGWRRICCMAKIYVGVAWKVASVPAASWNTQSKMCRLLVFCIFQYILCSCCCCRPVACSLLAWVKTTAAVKAVICGGIKFTKANNGCDGKQQPANNAIDSSSR